MISSSKKRVSERKAATEKEKLNAYGARTLNKYLKLHNVDTEHCDSERINSVIFFIIG